MKLRSKILLLLLPTSVLPLILLGGFAYVYINTHSYRATTSQMDTAMEQVAGNLKSQIDSTKGNIELLSASELFRRYMTADDLTRYQLIHRPLINQFRDYQHANKDIYDIRIFLPNGDEDLKVLSGIERSDHDRAGFLKRLFDGELETLGELSKAGLPEGGVGLDYVMAKMIKLRKTDSESLSVKPSPRGYFLIAFALDKVVESMTDAAKGQKGVFYLTNQTGEVFYSTDEKFFDNSKMALQSIVSQRVSSIRLQDVNNQSVYAGFKRITDKVFLVGIVPQAVVESTAKELGGYFIWIVFIAVICATLIIFQQVNALLINPINHLRRMVARFKEGHLEQDVKLLGNDELSELANDFREMSGSLAKSTEKVNALAYYDTLTGLPNRETFNICLDKSLKSCERSNKVLALLFIDLDNFKYVNDVFGHQAGDDLLKEAARRLESSLRNADVLSRQLEDFEDGSEASGMVVRLGGDEFTVLLTDLRQAHQASLVAQRIIDVISAPFMVMNREVNVGASVGIAMYPVDGKNSENLVKSADLAMYEAKQKGKNNYQFFTKALNSAVARRIEIEGELRKALKLNQFYLEYQPKVDLRSGKVTGVEALIRWRHPEKGVIPPIQFIPVAEDCGLINELGRYTLMEACHQLRSWANIPYFSDLTVAVNISGQHLALGDPLKDLQDAVSQYQINPEKIEIEITESILLKDEDRSIEILKALRKLGIKIALDDFGTGYSSLAYLRKFPIDVIKIDRGFVLEMEQDEQSVFIVKAIVDLARAMSLKVVVEGLETSGQVQVVQRLGCDLGHGYFFSRPVKQSEVSINFLEVLPKP
ncbi:MAG: EAL domain-containing protein [Hahellaceae bacterium]|nr:EAL domain-containing protein [Hahellaceae bacterium]